LNELTLVLEWIKGECFNAWMLGPRESSFNSVKQHQTTPIKLWLIRVSDGKQWW